MPALRRIGQATQALTLAHATSGPGPGAPGAGSGYKPCGATGRTPPARLRAANKTLLASLLDLAVLLVLSAVARLAKSATLRFVSDSYYGAAHARAGSATSDRWQAAMQANRAGHGYLAGGFYRTHKSAIAFLALMTRCTMHRLVLFGGIGPARWVFVSVVCDLRAASRGIMTEGVPPHPFRHLPDSCPSPPNRHKAGRAIYVAHPARVGHCSLHCSDRRQTGFAGAGKSLPP